MDKKVKKALSILLDKSYTLRALDSNVEEYLSIEDGSEDDGRQFEKDFHKHYGVTMNEMQRGLDLLGFTSKNFEKLI